MSGKRRATWTLFQVFTVFVLAFGTAGWVLPGYLALQSFITHAHSDPARDSFPYLQQAQRMLWLAAVWLFSVLFVWGFMGARRLLFSRAADARRRPTA